MSSSLSDKREPILAPTHSASGDTRDKSPADPEQRSEEPRDVLALETRAEPRPSGSGGGTAP